MYVCIIIVYCEIKYVQTKQEVTKFVSLVKQNGVKSNVYPDHFMLVNEDVRLYLLSADSTVIMLDWLQSLMTKYFFL